MSNGKGAAGSPSFRYFIFILSVCVFLLACLVARLATMPENERFFDYEIKTVKTVLADERTPVTPAVAHPAAPAPDAAPLG